MFNLISRPFSPLVRVIHAFRGIAAIGPANGWKGRTTHKVSVLWLLTYAAMAQVSCRDASGPGDVAREATMMIAASSSAINSIVGSVIDDRPAVITQDSNGNPIPGTVVTFAVVSGGGWVDGAVVVSNSAGLARVGSWTLGHIPGMNVMTATSGSLESVAFRASAAAGPPSDIVKLAGDNQVAPPGGVAPVRPQIKVTDVFGNGLPGIPVNFVVESGGGSLTDATMNSDSAGIATLGSWLLGRQGAQSIVASAGDLRPQTFTAMVREPFVPCGVADDLTVEGTRRSELTGDSCSDSDGRFYKVMTVVVTESTAYRFTLESPGFDTYLELRDDHPIAANDDRESSANSEIRAILPAGRYTLIVRSSAPGATGQFSVTYAKAYEVVDGCVRTFVARGIRSHQRTDQTDCVLSPYNNADRFLIYLQAGTPVTIQAEDLSYSTHPLTLTSPSGKIVGAGVSTAPYVDTLVFTPGVDGYYLIEVSNNGDNGAEYYLTVP